MEYKTTFGSTDADSSSYNGQEPKRIPIEEVHTDYFVQHNFIRN